MSVGPRSEALRIERRRLGSLPCIKWRRPAPRNSTFPVAVILKRFATDLRVLMPFGRRIRFHFHLSHEKHFWTRAGLVRAGVSPRLTGLNGPGLRLPRRLPGTRRAAHTNGAGSVATLARAKGQSCRALFGHAVLPGLGTNREWPSTRATAAVHRLHQYRQGYSRSRLEVVCR